MPEKATILYIEDDPGSQSLVQRTLSFAGYNVLVASRGLEGLDLASKYLPDLILMDINLPDLSGREVTTKLRSDVRFQMVPIVALTALSQAGEREKARIIEVLIAKPQYEMVMPGVFDQLESRAVDRLCEVNAADIGAETGACRFDRNAGGCWQVHGFLPGSAADFIT